MTFLVLLLALGLRLPLITGSLWLDEAIEALALMGRQGPLLKYALADFQPPLYHFVLYGWTRLAGFSELALRTPSLLAGLGTVWLVMKIGQTVASRKVGYFAGLLAATNPLLVYYSQEGRTYALTAFFATLLLYAVVSRRVRLAALGAAGVAWTSYLGWILVAVLAVYLMVSRSWKLFWAVALGSATILLWLPSFFSSLAIGLQTSSVSPEWGRVVGGLDWKSLPLTWVKFALGRISFANKYLYAGIVSTLALVHLFTLSFVHFRKSRLLWLWLLGPLAFGTLVAVFVPVYQYFRVLFVVPAYLLLLALGLSRAPRAVTAVVVAAQLACLTYFWVTPQFHREDWRSLTGDINAAQGMSLAVGMPSLNQDAPLLYYGLEVPLFEPKDQPIPRVSRIYYLKYVEDLFDTTHSGQANLAAAGYTIASQKVYSGISVDIYENRH